jgi:NADH:quinone reductase (non-electrogenic)
MTAIHATSRPPRVVIVGAGFGGLSAAKQLGKAPFDVTVVDRHNYHLFQPLLYQVATAGLSPGDIASPIRGILHRQSNAKIILAKVSGTDTPRRELLAEGRRTPYDHLVIATGAEHAYFGHDWSSYALGLKTIDDATYLRRRILLAFERAETEPNADERRRLLNFVVVGGGPTGVEMAGAIAELAKRALAADFRSIDPRCARIILIEAGPRLLAPFDPALSEAARRSLEQLGVEVRLDASVADCDCSGVSLGRERLQTRTIVWAAGVKASPAAQWLGAESDRAGRVKVQDDLSVPGHPNIFVIGDAAAATGPDGKLLPGVAPVAKQQGQEAARSICGKIVDGTGARKNTAGVSLSRLRCHGHHRSQACGRTGRRVQSLGARGLVAMEPGPHLFLDWLPQSSGGRNQLGLELRYVSARYSTDYRNFRRAHRRRDACDRIEFGG